MSNSGPGPQPSFYLKNAQSDSPFSEIFEKHLSDNLDQLKQAFLSGSHPSRTHKQLRVQIFNKYEGLLRELFKSLLLNVQEGPIKAEVLKALVLKYKEANAGDFQFTLISLCNLMNSHAEQVLKVYDREITTYSEQALPEAVLKVRLCSAVYRFMGQMSESSHHKVPYKQDEFKGMILQLLFSMFSSLSRYSKTCAVHLKHIKDAKISHLDYLQEAAVISSLHLSEFKMSLRALPLNDLKLHQWQTISFLYHGSLHQWWAHKALCQIDEGQEILARLKTEIRDTKAYFQETLKSKELVKCLTNDEKLLLPEIERYEKELDNLSEQKESIQQARQSFELYYAVNTPFQDSHAGTKELLKNLQSLVQDPVGSSRVAAAIACLRTLKTEGFKEDSALIQEAVKLAYSLREQLPKDHNLFEHFIYLELNDYIRQAVQLMSKSQAEQVSSSLVQDQELVQQLETMRLDPHEDKTSGYELQLQEANEENVQLKKDLNKSQSSTNKLQKVQAKLQSERDTAKNQALQAQKLNEEQAQEIEQLKARLESLSLQSKHQSSALTELRASSQSEIQTLTQQLEQERAAKELALSQGSQGSRASRSEDLPSNPPRSTQDKTWTERAFDNMSRMEKAMLHQGKQLWDLKLQCSQQQSQLSLLKQALSTRSALSRDLPAHSKAYDLLRDEMKATHLNIGFKVPHEVRYLMNLIQKFGGIAVVHGGFVRNQCFKRPYYDIDIAVWIEDKSELVKALPSQFNATGNPNLLQDSVNKIDLYFTSAPSLYEFTLTKGTYENSLLCDGQGFLLDPQQALNRLDGKQLHVLPQFEDILNQNPFMGLHALKQSQDLSLVVSNETLKLIKKALPGSPQTLWEHLKQVDMLWFLQKHYPAELGAWGDTLLMRVMPWQSQSGLMNHAVAVQPFWSWCYYNYNQTPYTGGTLYKTMALFMLPLVCHFQSTEKTTQEAIEAAVDCALKSFAEDSNFVVARHNLLAYVPQILQQYNHWLTYPPIQSCVKPMPLVYQFRQKDNAKCMTRAIELHPQQRSSRHRADSSEMGVLEESAPSHVQRKNHQ